MAGFAVRTIPRLHLFVSLNTADLQRIAEKFALTAREITRGAATALNDTARWGSNQTYSRLRKTTTLSVASLKQRIDVNLRASPENLRAGFILDKRRKGRLERPTLMSFGGKPNRPPYEGKVAERRRAAKAAGKRLRPRRVAVFTYQILRGGPRKSLPANDRFGGAFVARATRRYNLHTGVLDPISDGNVQAFRRIRGKRGGFHGEKLMVPRGVSPAALWQNKDNGIADDIVNRMRHRVGKKLEGIAAKIASKKFSGASRRK